VLKTLNRLWWRELKRIGKAQQREAQKLVKNLLVQSFPKTPRTAPFTVKKRTTSRKVSVRQKRAPELTLAPGKWLTSYFSSSISERNVPVRRMQYWLYLPHKVSVSPTPLVVMLHGCQQSATEFSRGTRMNQLAERHGFAVLYPQQSLKAHPHRCWNWYEKVTQEGGGEAELIAATIKKVVGKHALDVARIYVAGLSAGAAMAHIMAMNYPELIAAVGLHSGAVFGVAGSHTAAYGIMQNGAGMDAVNHTIKKFQSSHATMPAILIHGQDDAVVRPINLVQLTEQFMALNNLPSRSKMPTAIMPARKGEAGNAYKIRDYVHKDKVMLRVCEVAGLAHAWSGGDRALKFNAGDGPDASKMMWDFFAPHRRIAS
jgi:poly(hydroxyalkanoate) depolymerase family esterase